MRGATFLELVQRVNVGISIHAPLAGCDSLFDGQKSIFLDFNPRTPCGVRPSRPCRRSTPSIFQSTHPLRGATLRRQRPGIPYEISIHAPLAGCDGIHRFRRVHQIHFNPRTPCGVRHNRLYRLHRHEDFNPRTPCGVRLVSLPVKLGIFPISIHAPLAGCDPSTAKSGSSAKNFNPRTPCGVRPGFDGAVARHAVFQSTHPLRGATRVVAVVADPDLFQSTHPLRGATPVGLYDEAVGQFQSTHPLRGATAS